MVDKGDYGAMVNRCELPAVFVLRLFPTGSDSFLFGQEFKLSPEFLWGYSFSSQDAHVNVVTVDPEREINHAAQLVSAEILSRSLTLLSQEARQTFVFAHAFVNLLISKWQNISPSALRFFTGPFGKPRLLEPNEDISFSISYRKNMIAVALSSTDVGVDIEEIRSDIDLSGIARMVFTPDEQKCLQSTDGREKENKFFELWTRKEALLKASGIGLSGSQKVNSLQKLQGIKNDFGCYKKFYATTLAGPSGYALAMASVTL